MSNRKDELKAAIMRALDSPRGHIFKVTGDEPGRRRLAIAALITAKRELQPDVPELINVVIKPVNGKEDEIAIIKVTPGEFLDV